MKTFSGKTADDLRDAEAQHRLDCIKQQLQAYDATIPRALEDLLAELKVEPHKKVAEALDCKRKLRNELKLVTDLTCAHDCATLEA